MRAWIEKFYKKINPPQETKQERIRKLILQEVAPKRLSYTSVDAEEVGWYHIRTRYKIACMFAIAHRNGNDGIVGLVDGSQIVSDKAQSEQSLESAIKMRELVLKEYLVDLEDFINE